RARPASVPLRIVRWIKRNRIATALIVSLLVGFAAALGLLYNVHIKQGQLESRQKELEIHRANEIDMFVADVQKLGADKTRMSIDIPAARLAMLINANPHPRRPDTVRLTYAEVVAADPEAQALRFAPILINLEARMEALYGRPVMIDLRLYKFDGEG